LRYDGGTQAIDDTVHAQDHTAGIGEQHVHQEGLTSNKVTTIHDLGCEEADFEPGAEAGMLCEVDSKESGYDCDDVAYNKKVCNIHFRTQPANSHNAWNCKKIFHDVYI
jgi:hypothetical protein